MPKNPDHHMRRRVYNMLSRGLLTNLISPLELFAQCESEAFVRDRLHNAYQDKKNIPTKKMISCGSKYQISNLKISSLDSNPKREKSAKFASSNLRNSKELLGQANFVSNSVRPILYYYAGLNILE